jgi:hypothetical protein
LPVSLLSGCAPPFCHSLLWMGRTSWASLAVSPDPSPGTGMNWAAHPIRIHPLHVVSGLHSCLTGWNSSQFLWCDPWTDILSCHLFKCKQLPWCFLSRSPACLSCPEGRLAVLPYECREGPLRSIVSHGPWGTPGPHLPGGRGPCLFSAVPAPEGCLPQPRLAPAVGGGPHFP